MHEFFNFGYIDTGTGSLVVQSIIGIFAAIGVFGRRVIGSFIHKLRSLLSQKD